jgi:arylsulfatase A-like enzyme
MKDPARRSYAAVVTTTDHYIGLVLARLEELGLRGNTIVIFMSDNGHSEETHMRIRGDKHSSGLPKGHFYAASGAGNTGKWIGHKGSFLEGGLRVPAIISYPARLPKGKVRDQVVTAMDWYPTILELCGVPEEEARPKLDGFSMMPVLKSAAAKSAYRDVLHFGWQGKWAVREGDWKLIGDGKGKMTLHQLSGPEPEVKDHAGEQPELVARLTRLHDAWSREVTPVEPAPGQPGNGKKTTP